MRERRTYASWVNDVELRYAVNGHIMGSTIKKSRSYRFEILINTNPARSEDYVKCIQILQNHPDGKDDVLVVKEINFDDNIPVINCELVIKNADAKFFLIRVFHKSDIIKEGQFKKHGSTISAPVWVM